MENMENYADLLKLKGFSEKTQRSYIGNIKNISKKLNIPIDEITETDLRKYILKYKLTSSTQMAIINSFKSYYSLIFNRKFDHSVLPRPKVEQKQPDILCVEEMQTLLNSIQNIKHKAIVATMYSCALRVSELCNLKVTDIDANERKIKIKNGKGKIDRIVMLDDKILEMLRKYWILYRTSVYLFEGQKGLKYSATSVQAIIKKATIKAGITKKISTHSMRHSCLTQLIKDGVDLRRVQKIAGHKNINTTANYIKIIDSDILDTNSPIQHLEL